MIGGLIWNGENAISHSIQNTFNLFKSKDSLLTENKELNDKIQSMTFDTLAMDILREENKQLKEVLGRNENKNSILASVLRTPPFSPYDTFIIDVGKDKDIQIGDYILIGEHILLGEIVEVNQRSSKAKLFSSSGTVTRVLIGSKSIAVEAIGRGAGNFEVALPREVGIKVGDKIIIPNISSVVLGVVEQIDEDHTKTIQRVLFASPANIQSVRWVTVVSPASVI